MKILFWVTLWMTASIIWRELQLFAVASRPDVATEEYRKRINQPYIVSGFIVLTAILYSLTYGA